MNGRIDLSRARWYAAGEGSDSPLDRLLDMAEATVTVGLRQLCCQQGIAGRSFARSVKNLKSATSISMGEDLFRQVVESEGKAVLKASAEEQLEIDWSAAECKTTTPSGSEGNPLVEGNAVEGNAVENSRRRCHGCMPVAMG